MFKGKAIYNPSGKAGEYSYWACNLFKGCRGGCTYCYCKQGVLKKTLGGDTPKLKACFADQQLAKIIFHSELRQNLPELQKQGLFFSFTSDFWPETTELLTDCIDICLSFNVHVKILTKQVDWINSNYLLKIYEYKKIIAFGFTLTGCDSAELGCATNQQRIDKLKHLHSLGFITWASIEPILNINASLDMITRVHGACDLFKIGLLSGAKYDKYELLEFKFILDRLLAGHKVYYKDSFLKKCEVSREQLPENCVTRDYNIFRNAE